MNATIEDCIFKFISKNGNGGAIEVNTDLTPIHISYCHFESLSVSQSGGSIYLSTNTNSITSCYFFRTYSSANNNDKILGNAIFVVKGETSLENSATFRCGIDSTHCTDSSVRINTVCCIKSLNASANAGYEGGSGFSLRNASHSTISHIQVIDSLDYFAVENDYLDNEFNYINFINTTHIIHGIIYLTKNDVLTLNHCIFIDSFAKVSHPMTKLSINSCFSNSDFTINPGITLQEHPETNHIEIIIKTKQYLKTCLFKRPKFWNCFLFIYFLSK